MADEWDQTKRDDLATIASAFNFEYPLGDSPNEDFWKWNLPKALINLSVALVIPMARVEEGVPIGSMFTGPIWERAIRDMRELLDYAEEIGKQNQGG